MNVLLGVSGSMIGFYLNELIDTLDTTGHNVKVVMTAGGDAFSLREHLSIDVYKDENIYKLPFESGNVLLPLTLVDWADVLVLVPMSANTLAKVSTGIADDLLTMVVRDWDRENQLVLVPCMSKNAWKNPLTREHLEVIRRIFKVRVIEPQIHPLGPGYIVFGDLQAIVSAIKPFTSEEDCALHGCQWQKDDDGYFCARCLRKMTS